MTRTRKAQIALKLVIQLTLMIVAQVAIQRHFGMEAYGLCVVGGLLHMLITGREHQVEMKQLGIELEEIKSRSAMLKVQLAFGNESYRKQLPRA